MNALLRLLLIRGSLVAPLLGGAAFAFDGNAILITPVAKLSPTPPAESEDRVGGSVAIYGDTAVVGVPGHDEAGSPFRDHGEVLVFQRNGAGSADTWTQTDRLTPGVTQPVERFGSAVAVHGAFLVAGAPGYDESLSVTGSGATYVFRRERAAGVVGPDAWDEVVRLTADVPADDAAFGAAVAVSDDRIAVGAPGVTGGGAVYLFERNAGGVADSWDQVKKLTYPGGPLADASFGAAISLSGDRILVGAPGAGAARGVAFVFERNQGGAEDWGLVGTLAPPPLEAEPGDLFGWSVALFSDTAVVGSPGDDAKASGAGATYFFERNGGGEADDWGLLVKRFAPNASENERFGWSVDLWNDYAVVGAPQDLHGAARLGAVFLFSRNQGPLDSWQCSSAMRAPDGAPEDRYGTSVATWNGHIVIGASLADAGSVDSGSAYLRTLRRKRTSFSSAVRRSVPSHLSSDTFGRELDLWGDSLVVSSGSTLQPRVHVFWPDPTSGSLWGRFRELTAPGMPDAGRAVAIHGDLVAVSDPSASDGAGRVVLFERNVDGPDNWGILKTIDPPSGLSSFSFGNRVALQGRFLAVTTGELEGVSYLHVFERNRDGLENWGRVVSHRFPPPGDPGSGYVPASVAIGGEVILVGVPGYNAAFANQGAVWVFVRNHDGVADSWGTPGFLLADDPLPDAGFGASVSLSGDTRFGETAAIGAPGVPGLDPGSSGAVYIYQRYKAGGIGSLWGEVTKIQSRRATHVTNFGKAVSLSDSTLAVRSEQLPDSRVNLYERNLDGADAWGFAGSVAGGPVNNPSPGLSIFGRTVCIGDPQFGGGGRVRIRTWRLQTLFGLRAEAVGLEYRSSGFSLNWIGLSGLLHTVEFSDTLKEDDWHTLPGWERVPGVEGPMSATDQATTAVPERFYRLKYELDPPPRGPNE